MTPIDPALNPIPDARNHSPLSKTCWIIVLTLASFICLTQATAMLSMLVNRWGMPAAAPLALLISFIIAIACARSSGARGRHQFTPALLALIILLASTAFSAFYFDLSWDGQWYHQIGIYALARDWNTLTDPLRSFPLPGTSDNTDLWVRHYAKGPWYFAAAIGDATGYVEWGKSINLLALAASALAVFAAALDASLTRPRAAIIAAIIALNPVVMSELTSFLVDAVMIAFLLTTAAALFSYLRRPTPLLAWVILLASAISINAKFTGLIFLCFIFTAAALWCLWRQRDRLLRYLALSAASLFLGTCLLGYNPYMTNAIYRHNPFYPVLGSAAFPPKGQLREGIDKWETPTNLIPHNRVYRLLFATFARPSNAPYPHRPNNAELMFPFTATPSDLHFYDYQETRAAGFGPWFSGFLIFSILLFLYTLFRKGPARGAMILVALTLIASLLSNSVFWWPRYGPQFWILPALPAAFLLRNAVKRFDTIAAWTLLVGLLANALIVASVHLAWETRSSYTLRSQLNQLAQSHQTIEVLSRNFAVSSQARMDLWHISYVPARKVIPNSTELMSVVEGYPHPITYRILPESNPTTTSRP